MGRGLWVLMGRSQGSSSRCGHMEHASGRKPGLRLHSQELGFLSVSVAFQRPLHLPLPSQCFPHPHLTAFCSGPASSPSPGGRAPKTKKKAPPSKGGRKKKKKKGSDDEAFEDSDDGDFEGQEVDYMSDGSR